MTFLKSANLGSFDLYEDLLKATKNAWLNRSNVGEIRYTLMKHADVLAKPIDEVRFFLQMLSFKFLTSLTCNAFTSSYVLFCFFTFFSSVRSRRLLIAPR